VKEMKTYRDIVKEMKTYRDIVLEQVKSDEFVRVWFELKVEEWHDLPAARTGPLHEFMGMTWEEYQSMVSGTLTMDDQRAIIIRTLPEPPRPPEPPYPPEPPDPRPL